MDTIDKQIESRKETSLTLVEVIEKKDFEQIVC